MRCDYINILNLDLKFLIQVNKPFYVCKSIIFCSIIMLSVSNAFIYEIKKIRFILSFRKKKKLELV